MKEIVEKKERKKSSREESGHSLKEGSPYYSKIRH